MLPVVFYHINDQDCDFLTDQLMLEAERSSMTVQVQLRTDEAQQALDTVKDKDGIFLFITGVDDLSEDQERTGLKLGRMVMKKNRDNYTVFITQNRRTVEDVICLCIRPAGVMSIPLQKNRTAVIFRQILKDYSDLSADAAPPQPAGPSILLKVGGAMHKLNLRDIVYVQAMDKKIDIFTARQSIQAYKSMGEIAEMLGDGFIRCHRSCLINTALIQSVDIPRMTVVMTDGSQLPLSRSCKDSVCQAIRNQEAAACM